jgi:Protein of unknown function (DUF3892)
MADKWADYLISAVRYNAAETHIDAVKLHEDRGDTVGSSVEKSRQEIVALLEGDATISTIFKTQEGKWRQGAEVRIITVEGTKYIRTDADATKADNLGNLPRF